MKRNTKKITCFNMIEVALAMAIIAFGMTSILGLIPVGLNASRNAIAENYGADAAGQLIAYINSEASSSKTQFETFLGTSAATGTITEGRLPTSTQAELDVIDHPATGLSITFLTGYMANPATNRVSGWDDLYTSANSQVFFIVQGAKSSSSSSYDFSAMLMIWKTPITAKFELGNGKALTNTDASYNDGAGINMEISWPVEKYYNDREKRYYYFEIAKPKP